MKHPAQEPDIVPGRKLAVVIAIIVVVTIGCVFLAYGIGELASRDGETRWTSGNPPPIPPEVNAMETRVFRVEDQGMELHRRAEVYLARYGWVDRARGIVHVPISVAFELYLTRTGHSQGASR